MAKKQYKYKVADNVLILNDRDPDLKPIEIKLPFPPPLEEIAGYGLPPSEQVFKPIPLPRKLKELNASRTTVAAKWKKLSENPTYYKQELEFIRKMWHYRLNGYWFFNNGKPTWITGDHFFYMCFWTLDVGLPNYRSRDRKFFIGWWFCVNDPECFGMNYPKHRREGATSKTKCSEYEYISRTANAHSGMQSMTESSAETLFNRHVIEAWRKLPFFFQPIYDGSTNPKSGLFFYAPAFKLTEDNVKEVILTALDSSMTFRDSGLKAYDGEKLHRLHNDEAGKTEEVDIYARWRVQSPCLRIGREIIGKCLNTSTVGEMARGGGKNFKAMCDDSFFHEKDEKTKRTKTGLYTIFIPASDGFEGTDPLTGKPLIDKYGESDIESSDRVIRDLRAGYERDNNYEALSDLIREAPLSYKECWRQSSRTSNFNNIILQTRLDQLADRNIQKVRGNFHWKDNIKDTEVYFEPSPEGRFYVSYFFDNPKDSNRMMIDNGQRRPLNSNLFVAGGDPYRFKETMGKKKSKGAGAVFMKFVYAIDGNESDVTKWKTNRFVCTYSNRPRDKSEYGEDMIKMCVYFGCEMNPEINVPFLWDYFSDRGYGGYLFFRRNKRGYTIETPGFSTSDAIRETIFNEYLTYIERHGMREVHDEILEQCLDIEHDMTDYDLFVAGGYALLGAMKTTNVEAFAEQVDLDDYFQPYILN